MAEGVAADTSDDEGSGAGAVTPPLPPPPQPPLPQLPQPQPPQHCGDDDAAVVSVAFDDVVRASLLRRGERYLVFAPAVDRSVGSVGLLNEAERAGIGVLSLAAHGQHAEFRRLWTAPRPTSR